MNKQIIYRSLLAQDQVIHSLIRSTFDFSHHMNFEQDFFLGNMAN